MRTTGKQCGLAATGDYQPSLRSPWLAAVALTILNSRCKSRTGLLLCERDHRLKTGAKACRAWYSGVL
ncbi:hypothetical protein, partial [Thiolapillus sp.]|uniref:hypothetical protein n=1 Tax=Thiolapillus sp. TaxID=2017437 RepID=UPI003AF89CC7